MLLGGANTGEVDTLMKPDFKIPYYGFWVQDDIKITPKLTINAGLRYDIQVPITERHNQLNRGFNFTAVNPLTSTMNQSILPGSVYGGLGFVNTGGNSKSPFDMELTNIMPRVGAAYRVRNDIVVRGGWGEFYIPAYSQASSNGFSQITPYVGTGQRRDNCKPAFQSVPIGSTSSHRGGGRPGYDERRCSFLL